LKPVPWWAVASAGAAPVVLGGGLALAQARQPPNYDPVRDTISALAAHGAADRWVMTWALAGLGACHVVTALGLRPARRGGRMVLSGGGVATVMVAVFAQPARGNSMAHTVAATAAFAALATWPVFASSRDHVVPLLTRRSSVVASAVLVALVAAFAAELHGGLRGLAERAAAGAQALWPLAVVISSRSAVASVIRSAPLVP
jgi:hypothetical membrane protein